MLGNICLHRLPVPWTIALAVGAAVESNIVFLLLVSGVGNRVSFGLLGAARGSREGAGGSREHSPRSRGAGMLRGAVPDQCAGAGVGAGCPRVSPGTHVRIRALGRFSQPGGLL